MARKSSISRLPAEIKTYIEAMLATGAQTLDELIRDLQERYPAESSAGTLPSRSAVHRYGLKLDRRLSAIKASTEAAKIIHAQIGDQEDTRSGALIAMIQSELFDSIMDLQEASSADEEGNPMDPAERVGLLSMAAKNIATLTRSSVTLKKFQSEIEAATRKKLLAEQQANLEKIAKSQGMSQDQVDFWIRDFLGVR